MLLNRDKLEQMQVVININSIKQLIPSACIHVNLDFKEQEMKENMNKKLKILYTHNIYI